MNRVLAIARIQLTNWPTTVAYPLAMVASLAGLGWVIDATNGELGHDHPIVLLPAIYLMVAGGHLQAMTQMFPFTAGLGVTRRAFAAATALMVTGLAIAFGLVLQLFATAERATHGWGRHMQIFDLDLLRQSNPVSQFLVYTVPFLAVSSAAVLIGVVFQRWRQMGVSLLAILSTVTLAGLIFLVDAVDWWPRLGRFFTDQPTLALLAGYPLAIAAILAGLSWTALRRATP